MIKNEFLEEKLKNLEKIQELFVFNKAILIKNEWQKEIVKEALDLYKNDLEDQIRYQNLKDMWANRHESR